MSDSHRLPVEALPALHSIYTELGQNMASALSRAMALSGQYGVPNGAAAIPWAQMVGATIGQIVWELGLTDGDLDKLATLTAAAIPQGFKRRRDLERNAGTGNPPADPSLN